jgi:6-phosphogluconolactonase (cycloisomerase 2 family)
MFRFVRSRFAFVVLGAAVMFILLGFSAGSASADQQHRNAVYTSSNATSANGGNRVLAFNRAPNGSLTAAGQFSTGGAGTGAGLGSQGAIALDEDGNQLFTVNAGSNEVSSLDIGHNGLTLVNKVPSGGIMPISLTVHRHILYVLNAGSLNISGFFIGEHGRLFPIPGSTRSLHAGAAAPAQVSFSPDGDHLVVSEKGSSTIDVFPVNFFGIAGAPISNASHGSTPFGFAFDKRGDLIVSEAAANAVSSYDVKHNNALQTITGSLVDGTQLAPCWVVVTENGRFAYTTNAHSGTITGFAVAHNGSLSLLNANAITAATGGAPLDMTISHNDKLYVLNGALGMFNAFDVQGNGSLSALGNMGSIPASAAGIASR